MKRVGLLLALAMLAGCNGVWTDPSTGCRYLQQFNGRGYSYTIRFKADGKPDCPGTDAISSVPIQNAS